MLNVITGVLDIPTPPVTNSYESIQTVTVGSGGTSSISFTSIPSTYKHLQIRGLSRQSGGGNMWIRFNGDTASTYYYLHYLYGDGSSVGAGSASGLAAYGYTSTTSGIFGAHIVDVLDYTSTSKNKTVRSLGGFDTNGGGNLTMYSGLWSPTSPVAINSITIVPDSGSIAEYSSFALYGIKG